ncbi:PREDICTED: rapid alkalinization factor-like [Nicotiana attenuata]|uniref:Rapid alkalinization factor n=1 Tax=Nicotiana attenuata TaxID=49451 RepID=A0A1J6JND8_NICAT|nr:PREDICTED: rapid alkalinization factor-like [Nicotiana attenuata]XP_019265731.1 PREDICTED: rapid alkalinization factor-like [Nicotiana attenuata]OIT19325.1 rapid alkalinization factor [Nicotiana attenuata]OIT35502.1 rapid alkalinization factor [Nicotiana attenuata]
MRASCGIALYVLIVSLFISNMVDANDGTELVGLLMPLRSAGGICIGECMDEELELELDNRRILATSRRYISYGALQRNNVPCSRRGASYYNCRPGAQANPYSRGCSAITRCRR